MTKKLVVQSTWSRVRAVLGEILAIMVIINVLAFGVRLVIDLVNAKNTMANFLGFNVALFGLLAIGFCVWYLVSTLTKQLGLTSEGDN